MPRRPTRSRSSQPTRKQINRRLDDLSDAEYGELEPVTLAEVIAHDIETVDEEAGVVRIVGTGELRKQGHVPEDVAAKMAARGGGR